MAKQETSPTFIPHGAAAQQPLRRRLSFRYLTGSVGARVDTEEVTFKVAFVNCAPALAYDLQEAIAGCDDLQCVGTLKSDRTLNKLRELSPRVMLLDIDAFPGSTVEIITRVTKQIPDARIIMMTHAQVPEIILPAFKAGASGHVLKSASTSEVRDAIRAVICGGSPMTTVIARHLIELVRHPSQNAALKFNLTPREKEILDLICKGLTDKEMAERLGISRETVRTYVKSSFDKLGVRSRTAAAMKYHGF